MRTQVAIIGAGPAGLFLSHFLHRAGIESVILESRSREHVEARIRAGVVEGWAADLMVETGVGERMQREGLIHGGIYLSFNDELRHIDFHKLVGKGIMVYGQHEVVRDLIAKRLAEGANIIFDVEDVSIHDPASNAPKVRFRKNGVTEEISCDFIGGCDGFHGVSRPSVPAGVLTDYERIYPFGWLGILAEAPPVSDELIYAYHDRGFALFSMRSSNVVRLYLQCEPDEDISQWSDQRIWDELAARLAPEKAAELTSGPIFQKGVTAMRSFVTEPMQYGRLFLAGDAAHIVPPTGAKGMNLAIADVLVLSRAISRYYADGGTALLDAYSATCLRRVWKAQRFSWWMTQMLHLDPDHNPYDRKRQLAELDYLTGSDVAMKSLAENYVGLPLEM
ncbi:MAG TPA: 4-hydroxybenzoate 3-monooxygenase [Xanthobacteraceae bacterium]|nr:4-hydroxybenzoate 3-monooxygenase [Xanthobacteraceae bacterium]